MLADHGLGHVAHGEHGLGQVPLIEHVDDIALILGGIETPFESQDSIVLGSDARMVARGDRIEAQNTGPLVQPVELEVSIALDARVGRDALCVVGDVRVDDIALEVVGEVEDDVVDAQLLRDAPSIVDIADAAAAGIALAAPQTHGDTHDLVTLLLQKRRRDR